MESILTQESDSAAASENATSATVSLPVPASPPDPRSLALDQLEAANPSQPAHEAVESASVFAQRVFGSEFDALVNEPDPEFGTRGNNPHVIRRLAQQASEFESYRLETGVDPLSLTSAQARDEIGRFRLAHDRELYSNGHPLQDLRRRQLDGLHRIVARSEARAEQERVARLGEGEAVEADAINTFWEKHKRELLDGGHPDHAKRRAELDELHRRRTHHGVTAKKES
ncbi:MAG: hypothetical protein AAF430_22100 [Myxococcota bacterium]